MTNLYFRLKRPYPSIFFSDFNPSDIVLKSSVKGSEKLQCVCEDCFLNWFYQERAGVADTPETLEDGRGREPIMNPC